MSQIETTDTTAATATCPFPVPAGVGECPVARGEDAATRSFNRSMLISGTRCLLTYVVFPWILPLLGVTSGVGPAIGVPVGLVALGCDIFTIRRFWQVDHKWKWPVTVICSGVIALLLVLLVEDIAELVG